MKRKQRTTVAIALVAGVAVLLVLFLTLGGAQNADADHPAFSREHPVTMGPDEAKVKLTEFFDPACSACRAFYPAVKQLMRDTNGRVQLELRYAAFHRGSDEVIKMLEATRAQGRYWEALETVLARQSQWADPRNPQPQLVLNYLAEAKVDVERVKKEMNDSRIAEILRQDEADLVALRVNSTPSFFVNGRALQNFSEQGLRDLVNEEIAKAYP